MNIPNSILLKSLRKLSIFCAFILVSNSTAIIVEIKLLIFISIFFRENTVPSHNNPFHGLLAKRHQQSLFYLFAKLFIYKRYIYIGIFICRKPYPPALERFREFISQCFVRGNIKHFVLHPIPIPCRIYFYFYG